MTFSMTVEDRVAALEYRLDKIEKTLEKMLVIAKTYGVTLE